MDACSSVSSEYFTQSSWQTPFLGAVGRALKSTTGWEYKGNGDNSSGFNALPGGYRFDPTGSILAGIEELGEHARFWSDVRGKWSAFIRVLDARQGDCTLYQPLCTISSLHI